MENKFEVLRHKTVNSSCATRSPACGLVGITPGQSAPSKSVGGPTPQVATPKQLASFIGIAADDIAKLRRSDVDRVLSEAPVHFKVSLAIYIKDSRPDLAQEVDDVMSESGIPAQPEQTAEPAKPITSAVTEHAGLKIYPIKVKMGDAVVEKWAVQTPDNAQREKNGERQIGGDLIVGSREEAVKRSEKEAKRYADEEARKSEIESQEKESKAAEEERKAANRGKSILERRADAVLSKEVRDSETGTVMTRAQWVERRVNDGARPSIEMVDKIKPMSRTQFNRANNAEQRAHEAKIKAGGKVPEYSLGDYIVSKTEYDYAQKLIAESATQDRAQSVQVEPHPNPAAIKGKTGVTQRTPSGETPDVA